MVRAFSNLHYGGCELEFKNGWITIRPERPASSRVTQANRSALAKFMLRSNSDMPLSIDDQAKLMAPLPEHQANDLPWREATFLNCPETRFMDTPILRFYSEASAQQKVLMATDGMPLASLTSAEREILNQLVFGATGYQLVFTPNTGNDEGHLAEQELYSKGLLSEPTEALPNGLPPGGLVRMREESASCVFLGSSASKVPGVDQLMPDRLVMYKYAQDNPADQRPGNPVLGFDLNHFMVGKRTCITFTFQFTPKLSMTGILQDGNVTDLKPVSFEDLPKEFKADFYESYMKWAKMMSMRQTGSRGKAVPPP